MCLPIFIVPCFSSLWYIFLPVLHHSFPHVLWYSRYMYYHISHFMVFANLFVDIGTYIFIKLFLPSYSSFMLSFISFPYSSPFVFVIFSIFGLRNTNINVKLLTLLLY